MKGYQVSDRPVTGAQWDLLGMDLYAERLADYIIEEKSHFTLGVYGEWGEGKTSYVNLLKDKLCQREGVNIKFIEFSAWPYATADDLWRALIKVIAEELCGPPKPPEEKPSNWHDWLNATAITLIRGKEKTVEPPTEQESNCADLRSWANQAAYSGISKGTEEKLQLNQEVAMLAMVRAGVEALSLMSPLVSAVRNFIGFRNEVDITNIFQNEKSDVKKESIDSIQKLQEKGERLFNSIKGDSQVYVFVDDLDRCLPDVALDLLEAIKNFLNVGLIFIIAADEALIGQGLRLRYKELVSRISAEEMDDFITQKGREYFEKIIQFGVRVPPRTPEQAHRFIAAQFPQWQPATDIIQAAIGTNPRRLKQYCNLLTYKRQVGAVPLSMTGRDILVDEYEGEVSTVPARLRLQAGLLSRIRQLILNCGPVENDTTLRSLFVDSRIHTWRDGVPTATSVQGRVDALIDYLYDQYDQDGKNALVLFLQVMQEQINPQDACYEQTGETLQLLMGSEESEITTDG